MNKRFISILIILLLAILASTATMQPTIAADVISQQTCEVYSGGSSGQIALTNGNGYFALQNARWNGADPTAKECIYTLASGGYGWNFTKPNPSYNPIYPAQIDVRMYGMPVAGLQTAELDFDVASHITSPSSSTIMDLAWDVYLYDSTGNLADEFMIWMQYTTGNISPCYSGEFVFGCNLQPGAYLGGIYDGYNNYYLYVYSNTKSISDSGTYRQFRLVGTQNVPTKINLVPFIQELKHLEGSNFRASYIGSVDLGSEVWQGSGSVHVNSYSLQLGGASATTTFVGPTMVSSTSSTTVSSTSSTMVSSTSSTTVSSTSSTTVSSTSSTTVSSTSSLVTKSSSTQMTTSSITSLTTASHATTTALRGPSISLNASSGSAGSVVDVSGLRFSPSDTACSISGRVVSFPTCSVSGGTLTGVFTVANVPSGSYNVTATGTQAGDSASVSFTVPSPSITFSPASGYLGASIGVTGAHFSKADTRCSLSGNAVGTLTCSISNGSLTATFNVTSISAGTYTITATALPWGDSASATFTVQRASLTFNPASAPAGSNVTVSGVGFFLNDSSCELSGSSIASQSCSLSAGTLTGSFIVANVTTGQESVSYTVTATGSPAGDSTSASFILTSPARTITVNPFAASVGSSVRVDGSGFSSSDSTCGLSGEAVASQTCTITDGLITATFKVANVSAGGYTITVEGEPVGDLAIADFTVTSSSLPLALNPASGPAGATVQVSGSGFESTDSSCSLSGTAVSVPSCSITSGTWSGSFVVANVTAGSYTVTAVGSPSMDSVSTTFTVTVPLNTVTTTYATNTTSSTTAFPDFSLQSNSTIMLRQGQSSSVTVTVLSLNGFNSAVALSASWVGTAPAGVDLTITFAISPSSSGMGFGHLTITASPSASVGMFAVQVTGTSGSLTHSLGSNIAVTILRAVSTSSTSSTGSATSSTTSVATLPTTCPVSTATSGSALAPLAQGLRVFRDQSIMKTRTGAAFMTLFNTWYYSFSPPLASYLGIHRTQRVAFGYTLYPLIGLLYASYYTYVLVSPLDNEVAAVAAGLVAAAIMGFVYIAPPLYLTTRVLRRKISTPSRLNPMHLLALSVTSIAVIGLSYFAGRGLALGFASASLLLSVLTLGVIGGILALERVSSTINHLTWSLQDMDMSASKPLGQRLQHRH